MHSMRWDEMGVLLEKALALPSEERAAFLDEACRGDAVLRAELAALLAHHEEAPAFSAGLAEVVRPLLPHMWEEREEGAETDPYGLVGRVVSHYQVLEKLGGGGMGVVYRARDLRLDRFVALKFLPPHVSTEEKAKERFIMEARAASALDHPNICTIYDIREAPAGQLFIVMAYYAGETLKKKIVRGPLPVEEALHLAVQIARGLARAHAQGIVHRDVKPANVMVTQENVVKIVDFGLAKLAGGAQLTGPGVTMGTVAYMSPEQARGEAVDHRTDVWSLGVVLYEMLTGQRPFQGAYQQAMLYAIVNEEPEPVTALRSGLPLQLAHLINKALAKPLHERYQHMNDLLTDLEAIQQKKAAWSSVERAVLSFHPSHGMADGFLQQPSAAMPAARASAGPGDGPVKILVVDDEPELELLIRQKFRHRIHANEWTFVFAADGVDALDRLQADPEIALILTDLNMPEMDGLTLLARLSELNRPLKTVVVSAYGDMDNIRTAMNRGAFDFVTKPVNFKDLETTIYKTWQELRTYRQAVEAQHRLVAIQQELEVARRIQEAMLPPLFPKRDDVDLYAFMTTAHEVGGDFYDFFLTEKDQVGFVVGEVAGKGVSAALFMAVSQTFLKGIALQGSPPGACLTSLNRLLFPGGFPDLSVRVFYGLLDTRTGELAYANAGHPSPYLLRPDGTVAQLDTAETVPVWRTRDCDYVTRQAVLRPGEGLFLFTDGVTGATDRHGHRFSEDRLAALLWQIHKRAPAEMIRGVVRAVMHFSGDVPPSDDLTVLALRYLDQPAAAA